MRIALDLQACQTASRHRGIGRYSLDLTRALLGSPEPREEFIVGLDGTYREAADQTLAALSEFVPAAAASRYFYPGPTSPRGDPRDALRPISEVLVKRHYSLLSPDLIQVNSLFEGYAEHAVGLGGLASVQGAVSSVTLYDFIPQIFATPYLDDPRYAAWYSAKLALLHRFDVLLCISEATRRDAIRILGIPAERFAVIHAGIDPRFKSEILDDEQRRALALRHGIRGRFVLYTGNGDFRKNLAGAIHAFASVPRNTRQGVQLVLNQVDDEAALRELGQQAGLAPADLVVTGMVSDQDLIELFRSCDLFIFPSLYEGFGLPVLEAMACGAPALVANNSSLPEVMDRADALFDASDAASITAALVKGLSDADFRRSLSRYGAARAAHFTWHRSASLAVDAWKEAFARKQTRDPRIVVSSAPRQKIAMVTPLPPERSGIADYAALLLLPLSRHVDIDVYTTCDLEQTGALSDQFSIFPSTELPANADLYDHIVYQFGNSPFHSHMVSLINQHPGVVVLHDFFLSSMYAYMDQYQGLGGIFVRELEYAHGRGAVDYFAKHGIDAAKERFSLSRHMIEKATAVIAHSAHSRALCDASFPCMLRPSWHHVPMLQSLPAAVSPERRSQIRVALGVAPSDFLIVSFGFLAPTKLNHVLLDALANSYFGNNRSVRLVFVGEPDGGEYGEKLRAQTAGHAMRNRISITGFAAPELYEDYLVAADCAVQLRTTTRGETSKAVFDCLAHALPTVVNNMGSLQEIPSHVVVKIDANAAAEDLATALKGLLLDDAARKALGVAARNYVACAHAPDLVAAAYAVAFGSADSRRDTISGDSLQRELIDIFSSRVRPPAEFRAVEAALKRSSVPLRASQIFIDLSEVVATDYGTGIHRVVRNLAREMILADRPTVLRCIPVAHDAQGTMSSAEDFVADKLRLTRSTQPLIFNPRFADVLLLLDSAWENPERFLPSIHKAQGNGGRVAAMLYDLIPIRFPQHCVEFMPAVFERWLRFVVEHCDQIVCISRSTARDLSRWIEQVNPTRKTYLRIDAIGLGSDLKEADPNELPSEQIRTAMQGDRSVLMVGTLEPRKRYDIALCAFDSVWKAGSDLRLIIIGKQGWKVDGLAERVRTHAQYGKRLFWLEHATDADLNHAYQTAHKVLMTSDAEGFGLPIVEAARFKRALLLSDIDIFREVAGNGAEYFKAGDAAALEQALVRGVNPKQAVTPIVTKSWADAARELAECVCRLDSAKLWP